VEQVDAKRACGVLAAAGAVAWQRVAVGDYVLSGDVLADVAAPPGDGARLAEALAGAFRTGAERSLVSDVDLPTRQLADIALRGCRRA